MYLDLLFLGGSVEGSFNRDLELVNFTCDERSDGRSDRHG